MIISITTKSDELPANLQELLLRYYPHYKTTGPIFVFTYDRDMQKFLSIPFSERNRGNWSTLYSETAGVNNSILFCVQN